MTPRLAHLRLISWLGVAALLLGLWQISTPIALGDDLGGPATTIPPAISGGTVAVVLSLLPMMSPPDARWTAPLFTITGWWIVAGPWLAEGATSLVRLNDVVVGGTLALVGFAVSLLTRQPKPLTRASLPGFTDLRAHEPV
ncbi:hypothetical protein [Actinosynnema sp. NPDC020468]|uniref:SPW repeat domain-containing protein n=1 Tax=Actinosynnema sp. NPDC020468 TaxID=3154488 RepID=UPI0033D5FF7E